MIAKTFAEAYQKISNELLVKGEEYSPRNQKTKELRDYKYTITDPTFNLFENEKRSIPKGYLGSEMLWYLSGSNKLNFISKSSSFWNKIKNPDGTTVNSAYGHLIFKDPNEFGITEWDWAKTSIADDRDTRQAVIRFNKPKHSWFGNRDFTCTFYGIFMVRDNMLHLTIHQRSCDVMTGLSFDVPFFTSLITLMKKELELEYDLNLQIGTFTHIINSLHVYEKDFERLQSMLEFEFEPKKLPELGYYTRELLDGIITEKGTFDYDYYQKYQPSLHNDPLIDWCLNKTKWLDI